MVIQTANSDEEILKCWDAMRALRPHLIFEEFTLLIHEMQQAGAHLIFIEENGKAVSAAVYRRQYSLFAGRHIYIDDLITLPEGRGKGYGGALLDHVIEIARAEGLNRVTLDSGHQRFDAHRLYLNKGFQISSHHFTRML